MTTTRPRPTWAPPRFAGPPRTALISPMLRNILESLCEGKNNELIAADWGIGLNTVKTHVTTLLKATGARDRLHLATLMHSGELVVEVGHRGWARNDQAATVGSAAAYCPAS